MRHILTATYKVGKRIVIFIVGSTVVLIGAVMFFTPGPALVVIPAGLAILGIEFAWARRWLKMLKEKTQQTLGMKKDAKKSDADAETDASDQKQDKVD